MISFDIVSFSKNRKLLKTFLLNFQCYHLLSHRYMPYHFGNLFFNFVYSFRLHDSFWTRTILKVEISTKFIVAREFLWWLYSQTVFVTLFFFQWRHLRINFWLRIEHSRNTHSLLACCCQNRFIRTYLHGTEEKFSDEIILFCLCDYVFMRKINFALSGVCTE